MKNNIYFKKGQRWILPEYDNIEVEITGASMSDKVQVKFTSVFGTNVTTTLSKDDDFWGTAKLVNSLEAEEPTPKEIELVDGEVYVKETASEAWVFRFKEELDSQLAFLQGGVRAYYATLLKGKPVKEVLSVGSIVSKDKEGIRVATEDEVFHLEYVATNSLLKAGGDVIESIILTLATPYQKKTFNLYSFTDPRELLEFVVRTKEPLDTHGEPLVDGSIYTVGGSWEALWVFRYKSPSRDEKSPKNTSCYSCLSLDPDDGYYATGGFVVDDEAPIKKANSEEVVALIAMEHEQGNLMFKE